MHIMMFTERPYYDVPEDEIIKNASYFGIPNEHFNAEVGGGCTTRTSTRPSTPRRWASTV